MAFKISKVMGKENLDSMQVALIADYPLEKRDYKPYAQCVMCFSENELVLRMWAFEVSTAQESCLAASLYLFAKEPDTSLCLEMSANGNARGFLSRDGIIAEESEFDLEMRPYIGEDLQGVYWGGTLRVPYEKLAGFGGWVELKAGDHFIGNFFKICNHAPFEHLGSFFSADFSLPHYSKKNMGRLEVVGY